MAGCEKIRPHFQFNKPDGCRSHGIQKASDCKGKIERVAHNHHARCAGRIELEAPGHAGVGCYRNHNLNIIAETQQFLNKLGDRRKFPDGNAMEQNPPPRRFRHRLLIGRQSPQASCPAGAVSARAYAAPNQPR